MADQLREALEKYFAEFPPQVAEAIHRELTKESGLNGLLQRLSLPTTGGPAEQYAAIIKLLRRDGLRPLENLVGYVLSGPISREEYGNTLDATRRLDAEHTRIQSPPPDTRKYTVPPLPTAKPAPTTGRLPLIPVTAPTTPTPPPATRTETPALPTSLPAAEQTPTGPPFPFGPLKPGIPPAPGTFDSRTPSWDPKKPYDPNGEWPAVERRSGRERRKGPRRRDVQITYRNRRFGKDRRTSEERRKNWPRGGHQP